MRSLIGLIALAGSLYFGFPKATFLILNSVKKEAIRQLHEPPMMSLTGFASGLTGQRLDLDSGSRLLLVGKKNVRTSRP